MIVPMNKVLILAYRGIKDELLSEIRRLGAVHIDVSPKAEDGEIMRRGKLIARVKLVLKKMPDGKRLAEPGGNMESVVEKYESLADKLSIIDSEIGALESQYKRQLDWGDFDPELLKTLASDSGFGIRLFTLPAKKIGELSARQDKEEFYYAVVGENAKNIKLIVFETKRSDFFDSLGASEAALPKLSLAELKSRIKGLKSEKEPVLKDLKGLSAYKSALEKYSVYLQSEFDFEYINNNLKDAAEGAVFVIQGWIPRQQSGDLENLVKNYDAACVISKPELGENVPVLLKNSRYSRLFESIGRLFDLPKYTELDLTPLFAPFFTLFFGLCLGDAGYGFVILAASVLFRNKLKEGRKMYSTLGIILGSATVVVGLVSGGVFGVDTAKVNYLKNIVFLDQNRLFNLAIILGVIQILFGMCVKTVNLKRQFGFAAALPTIGWIMLILGALARLGLGLRLGTVFVIGGVGLILFFNNLRSNIFVRLGTGLWELYGITGVFGDVLSYIRLFALGLSGAILGFVVNEMAGQIRMVPYAGFVLAFIFLIIGHTGNLLLCSLGAFVHPLRLTFVEFYKNAGFMGGGKEYKPFKKADVASN